MIVVVSRKFVLQSTFTSLACRSTLASVCYFLFNNESDMPRLQAILPSTEGPF